MISTIPFDDDLRRQGYAFRTVRGVSLLLHWDGQRIRAFKSRCPHMGCQLSRGRVEGRTLICPCHEWRFEMASGEMELSREIRLAEYVATIGRDGIDIEMED